MNQDIEPQVIQGNLAVHRHPQDVEQFGDGSVEVQGTIYVDKIVAYSVDTTTTVHETEFKDKLVSFSTPLSAPATPSSGKVTQFVDPTLKRLKQINDAGELTALVSSKGDLITSDGTQEVIVGRGTNGFVLTADSNVSAGLAWRAPATFSSVTGYTYVQSLPESNTNATVFVTKLSLGVTVSSTTLCRLGTSFEWRMTAFDQLFKTRIILDDTTVILECSEFSTGVGSYGGTITHHTRSGFNVVSLSAGTHTFKLQWCLEDPKYTAYISNAALELWFV
jgi:hypothetical protein